MEWQYFDFEAHWREFLDLWNKDEVKHAFELDIYRLKELDIGRWRSYKHGDPLWKMSGNMYWPIKIAERAQELCRQEQHLHKMKKTLRNMGWHLRDPSATYRKVCMPEVLRECSPKQDSLESFVFSEGIFVYANSMFIIARHMFPGEEVKLIYSSGTPRVLVPRQKIVFDLMRYYYHKYDKKPSHVIDQGYYNSL